MRMKLSKKLIMLLVFLLCIPAFWNSNTNIAQAATPKFAKSKIELTGVGEIYQVVINNKVAKSTYKWTTSDKTVVKVSSKGVLTTVSGGTATIRCKITYPSKTTKSLACKVTVKIPADGIRISNAQDKNGAHTMTIGGTYQFQSEITPANTTDKVFWSIGTGDKECIRIDNAETGAITALKAGKVTLKATAAKDATEAVANGNINIKNDAIIIEVVAPKAEVTSAEITGPTEIKVVFDSPVDKSTVIDSSNRLTSNIKLTLGKDAKNVLATDPGTLTPSLSTDAKTLTITSANMFTGTYIIEFTSGIKTSSGVVMEGWYKTMTYIDTTPPAIYTTNLDDTGMINNILFTEPVDITSLKVAATELYSGSNFGSATATTIATLNNTSNYILSTDKRTLTINLSKISPTDYGRTFNVTFTGIKDLSGLYPANYTLSSVLRTDSTKREQAVPIQAMRTAYDKITVIFSRGIQPQSPGSISISGGGTYYGTVDSEDPKKVIYTISAIDGQATGSRTITVSGYNSYNVIETDTSAYSGRSLTLDFTVDNSAPILITPDYDAASQVLTLTFNEEVNLTSTTGVFSAILDAISGERKPGIMVNYTQIANVDKKVVKLKLTNLSLLGNYTITVDPGFAEDNFRNKMVSRVITLSNTTSTSSELPGPFDIRQSSANFNEINLEFVNMVDFATAQNPGNYTIPGVTVQSAYVLKNAKESGATVVLTVAEGSITASSERPITIKGVQGYNGAYSAITSFTKMVELKENVKPLYNDASFDRTMKNKVILTFSEQIKGNMTFRVTQSTSSTPVEIGNAVEINANKIIITLNYIPPNGSTLYITPITNNITDIAGNVLPGMPSPIGVAIYY